MKHSHLGLAAAGMLCLLCAGAVQATPVLFTDSAPQTTAGQDFTFSFNPAPLADGNTGVLTIQARGDYGLNTSTEFLSWDIDSLGIGGTAGPVIGGTTILLNNGINDVEWRQSFIISAADLLAITADSMIDVLIDLNLTPTGNGVNLTTSTGFVSVSLSYNTLAGAIPEPGTLALFAGGMGLVGWRNRSQR